MPPGNKAIGIEVADQHISAVPGPQAEHAQRAAKMRQVRIAASAGIHINPKM